MMMMMMIYFWIEKYIGEKERGIRMPKWISDRDSAFMVSGVVWSVLLQQRGLISADGFLFFMEPSDFIGYPQKDE